MATARDIDVARERWALALVVACAVPLAAESVAASQFGAVAIGAALTGLAGVLAAVLMWRYPCVALLRARVAWAGAAVLAWLLVSALASSRAFTAFAGEPGSGIGWLALAAMAVVVAAASGSVLPIRRALALVAPWLVLAQVAAVVIQLVLGVTARGTLPNSTYLGQALLLLLPWVVVGEGRAGQKRYAVLALAGVAALAASGARVAAVFGLVWLAWWLATQFAPGRRGALLAAGALATIAAAAALFARDAIGSALVASSWGVRPAALRLAAKATAESPLLGAGPDGFLAAAARYSTPDAILAGRGVRFSPGAVDPHNALAWLAVSGGLVVLALFAWFVVELAIAWRAQLRAGDGVAPAIWGVIGMFAVLLTAPAASMVLPLFALVLGASIRPLRRAAAPTAATATRAIAVFLGACSLVLAANALSRLPLQRFDLQVSPRRAPLATTLARAWRVDPYLYYLASLQQGWAAVANPALRASEADLVAAKRAAELDERDPVVALEYARALRAYGRGDTEVRAAFVSAIDRFPGSGLAHAEYAVYLAQRGDKLDARVHLKIAQTVSAPGAEVDATIAAAKSLLGQ